MKRGYQINLKKAVVQEKHEQIRRTARNDIPPCGRVSELIQTVVLFRVFRGPIAVSRIKVRLALKRLLLHLGKRLVHIALGQQLKIQQIFKLRLVGFLHRIL